MANAPPPGSATGVHDLESKWQQNERVRGYLFSRQKVDTDVLFDLLKSYMFIGKKKVSGKAQRVRMANDVAFKLTSLKCYFVHGSFKLF